MRFSVREVLFLLLILAMPVASYLFVFQPRNEQMAKARDEIIAKQAKLARLETATKNFKDLGDEIDRLSRAITMYEQKLPAQREVEVVLEQVWELATKHNLVAKSIRTDKPVESALYAELPIRMVIVGDFDGFYSFLLDLEKLPRITRTPQMKLSKLKNDEGKMSANMVMSIYFDSKSPS